MRIHEITKLTGLSKKAIYYYIDEHLITPKAILENGYFDFDDNDLANLKIIVVLRQLNMPISMIKETFEFPSFTNYFLHSHFNNLKQDLNKLIQNIELTCDLIDTLPPNARPNNLIGTFNLDKPTSINYPIIEHLFENNDARMITILIWGSFLDIEASEYHKYLWNKISSEFKNQINIKLNYLSKLIYTLSPTELNNITAEQFSLTVQITDKLTEVECTNLIISAIEELICDQTLIDYWLLTYDKLLKPMFEFCNGDAHALLLEYNQRYKKYISILNRCSEEIINNPNNLALINKLKLVLNNKINIEHFNHFELSSILTFKDSLYTNLDFQTLTLLLED